MPRGGRAVAAPMLLVHVHVEVVPRVGGVLAVGAGHRVHLVQVHSPVVVLQVGRASALLRMANEYSRARFRECLRAGCHRNQNMDHEAPSRKNDLRGLSWCI